MYALIAKSEEVSKELSIALSVKDEVWDHLFLLQVSILRLATGFYGEIVAK